MNVPSEIKSIVTRVEQAGGNAMLVGGAVIDVICERQPKDWDIEVFGLSFERLESIFEDKGAKMVGREFGILKLSAEKCGGFDVDLKQKKTERKVINESKNRVHNDRGTLAMARLSDPDSAGSQFFINQRNNPRLDWTPFKPGYTVFGEVITGMRIVDFMASTPTGNALGMTDKGQMPLQNVPLDPIVLVRVARVSP